MSTKEKVDFITSDRIFRDLKEQELIEVILHEGDIKLRGLIVNGIKHQEGFKKNHNIYPYIKKLSEINKNMKILFLNIIIHAIDRLDESDNKKNCTIELFNELKDFKDPILKTCAINSDNHGRLFKGSILQKLCDENEEIELYSFKTQKTMDLVENTTNLLEKVKDYNPVYVKLLELFEPFKNSCGIKHEDIKVFLQSLFNLFQFPSSNKLLSIYSSFSIVEETLITSIANYRDHVKHSFRVFLLGFQVLVIKKELELAKNVVIENQNFDSDSFLKWSDLLCWLIAAFFHDVGYGIEKTNEISEKIEENYADFGTVRKAKFILTETLRLFGERIIQIMQEILLPKSRDHVDYPFSMLIPLLKSWEDRKHGIMSSIIVLKEIDRLISSDYQFQTIYRTYNQWETIFLRAAMAMTIHTFPTPIKGELNIEELTGSSDHSVYEQLFPSFLLVLIDAVEYIDRPIFSSFDALERPLKKDIAMDLQIGCFYSIQRFKHIKIDVLYKEKKIEEIIKIAKKFQDLLFSFISREWGVTITIGLSDNKDEKIKLLFLRQEEKKFKEFLQQNTPITSNNELELYKDFTESTIKGKNSKYYLLKSKCEPTSGEESLKKLDNMFNALIPNQISPQIKESLKK